MAVTRAVDSHSPRVLLCKFMTGIPEAWGIIFCCCQLYPLEKIDVDGKKVKIIRKKIKIYTPCGSAHREDSWAKTKAWIITQATCKILKARQDMKDVMNKVPPALIIKPLAGWFGTAGVDMPTSSGAPAAQEMTAAGGPKSEWAESS